MNKFQPPFRQSQIVTYMICQRRFYYAHIIGLEREFTSPYFITGNAMHKAIWMLHDGADILSEDALRYIIDRTEAETILKENCPVRWTNTKGEDRETQVNDWIDDTLPILKNYWSKSYNRDAQIIYAETEFRVNIGPFPFIGTIDQLRLQDNEYHLIDFKSGTSGLSQTFLDLDYQLSIYAYACAYGKFKVGEEWINPIGIIPHKLAVYKLNDHLPYKNNSGKNGKKGEERGPGRYFTTRTLADFEAMIRDLGFICRSIIGPHYGTKSLVKGGSFARNPINVGGLQTCGQCPYQQECLTDRQNQEVSTTNIETLITDEDFANVKN
jgi:RecB family exonuclease